MSDDLEVEKYFGEIENKKVKRKLSHHLNNSDKINIEFAINFLLERTVGETTEEVKQIFTELLEKVRRMKSWTDLTLPPSRTQVQFVKYF